MYIPEIQKWLQTLDIEHAIKSICEGSMSTKNQA